MITPSTKFKTTDEYFSVFPAKTKSILKVLRKALREAAPQATEVISYNMPAIKLNGILVYYAAYENHIGFYPTSSGITNFKDQLSGYKNAKGSVQFRLDQPLPLALISNIVQFRLKEDTAKKATAKKEKTKTAKKIA